MKIAIVGIQGIPAKYGGFETLVENLVKAKNNPEIRYTVYCSSKDFKTKLNKYNGAELKYIPFRANGWQSTPYDIFSLVCAAKGHDVIFILGVSGCIFLPVFRLFYKKKIITSLDGLEYKRSKWNGFAKQFLRLSEWFAVKFSDIILTDNKGIQDYVLKTYKKDSVHITYGGDHAIKEVDAKHQFEVLNLFGLENKEYSLVICRIEPENNCDLILEAFARTGKTILFVGNWGRNPYRRNLKKQYAPHANIHIIDSIYDADILYVLRKHCKYYIHGHSVGGTNPSLIEAMFTGCNILAYDCVFNKETTEYKAFYFKDINGLSDLICSENGNINRSRAMREVANRRYKWESIVKEYESLFLNPHQ